MIKQHSWARWTDSDLMLMQYASKMERASRPTPITSYRVSSVPAIRPLSRWLSRPLASKILLTRCRENRGLAANKLRKIL